MKNAKHAGMKEADKFNYYQADNEVKSISAASGTVVMKSADAWERYKWVRKYFGRRPKEGYFVWIKKNARLLTCITACSRRAKQEMNNLVVVERGVSADIRGVCNAAKQKLSATHKAQGKIILKRDANVKYNHLHHWGRGDSVETDYEFVLERGARLEYNYTALATPSNLKIAARFLLRREASVDTRINVNANHTRAEIRELFELSGSDATALSRVRIVANRRSYVSAYSCMSANKKSKGHLDCRGLILSSGAGIEFTPKLINRCREAVLTHEAGIGRISERELTYLRSRGLDEKRAIDLIVKGFLE